MDAQIAPDGSDSFVLGMNSYTQPSKLENGEYAVGMNIMCRGGIAQTRPGSVSKFDLPAGNLQGLTFFTPSSGVPYLVFCVGGTVYVSPAPFTTYAPLANVAFNANSSAIAWAATVQTTYFDEAGIIRFLDQPKAILIMQDGATRAAYWDGIVSGHLNPTQSTTTQTDRNGTPVGLWMCWSNNRLWVSRGSQVFASDIGNPLKFTESQYISEGRAFYLPGECTGIVETADRQGIICFTKETGTFLQSAIQDRTQWLSTPNFQQNILVGIGCISHRSIVSQYGMIWWYTSKGLINLNSALNINISSRTDIQDNEMLQSKIDLSYNLTGVCGQFYENFLLHALPVGEKLNSRVHVLDQAPFEGNANSWASYWTGWRPVEFARGVVSSQERLFCVSVDYDGVNRLWELMRPEKTDNGIPITCFIATREHFWGNRDWKRFRYAELEFVNVSGDVAIMVAARGTRGAFQPILRKDVAATLGQVYADSLYGNQTDFLIDGSKVQSRIIRSEDNSNPSDCNAECVEYEYRGLVDKGFSFLVVWSGIAGLYAYRGFSQNEPQTYQGICEDDETGETRLLTPDGCGSTQPHSTSSPFETFSATVTFSKLNPETGLPVSKTCTQSSIISQVDATRKATAMAQWYVLSEIGEII